MKTDNCPLISVITLSYNSPDLLGAIDSVLSQDYANIEYILLDDGTPSFDETQIKEYIAKNQKGNLTNLLVRKSPKRLGIIKETNYGLENSHGKYIFNLAGDDQFKNETVLTEWVAEFERTGAEIITAYREVYDENMSEALYIMPSPEQVNVIKNFSPEKFLEYVEGYNIVLGCCTARSRKNFEEMGFIDEKYKLVDDYVLLLKALRMGKRIGFFDKVVVKYRSGGVSSANRINKEYLRDNDSIFYHELLPYSTNKRRAKRKYHRWRSETIWIKHHNKFNFEIATAQNNKLKIFSAYCKLGIKHPKRSLLILKQKIKTNLRKGSKNGYKMD